MNELKAREHFSAYYEGTLSEGLRQALDLRMAADASLKAEYASFAATIESLNQIRESAVEVPPNLHDLITARIDRKEWEAKRSRRAPFGAWLKSLAFGGVAVLAVVLTVMSLSSRGNMNTSGFSGLESDHVSLTQSEDGALLSYWSRDPKDIVIRSGIDGAELRRLHVDGELLRSPLQNHAKQSALISVEVGGDQDKTLIALPGQRRVTAVKGEGTLTDFALAASGYYRIPVVIASGNPDMKLRWEFTNSDPVVALADQVRDVGVIVEQRETGILYLRSR